MNKNIVNTDCTDREYKLEIKNQKLQSKLDKIKEYANEMCSSNNIRCNLTFMGERVAKNILSIIESESE